MKSIFQSKTVWLGVLVVLIPALQAFQTLPMPAETAQFVSGLLGLLIIINRFYTTTGVTITKPAGDI